MNKAQKIQNLLVNHLLKEGHIELTLPDGMILELGIVQENKNGELEKAKDYCWVIASQKDRTISMDSYNFGLRYNEQSGKMLIEDSTTTAEGKTMRVLTAC